MAAVETPKKGRKARKQREFVIRLDSPGLYDQLFRESVKRSRQEQRRVPMTEITREALDRYLNPSKYAGGAAEDGQGSE
jgi:hypothetical protein